MCLPLFINAQNEGLVWYFGIGAGLDFSNGDPVQIPGGAMETFEGCAIVSDAAGNVVFYTNGGGRDPELSGQTSGKIWNRDDEVMYDMGVAEGGGFSARQSALILPKPESTDVYFLFTMEEAEFDIGGSVPGQPFGRGLSLFEIDMNLNGGLGGVTLADQRIFVPSFEGLTGTIHQNGMDHWVVISEESAENNRLLVFPVTSEGIADTLDFPFSGTLGGALHLAPNGKWLYCGGTVFPFDNGNGAINVDQAIDLTPIPGVNRTSASFSPNSRYLYFLENTPEGRVVAQYDLDAEVIVDSRFLVANLPDSRLGGQMQMGPDGNIYFIERDFFSSAGPTLSVIECPDSSTPSLTPDLFVYPASEDFIYTGLPNFSDHIFATTSLEAAFELDSLTSCEDELVLLSAPELPGVLYTWSTGDTTRQVEVEADGVYTVTISNQCESLTDSIMVSYIDCDTAECQIFLPNTFTPNNDGDNDFFGPLSNCEAPGFVNYLLRIYNRWGNLVYETTNPDLPWNGEQDNQLAPTEVYFYQMQFQLERQESIQNFKGDITLIR